VYDGLVLVTRGKEQLHAHRNVTFR